jgi:hypothetical protein
MNKPSEQIENAQYKLHAEILAALTKFSEETGLSVVYICWQVSREMDHKGNTKNVCYNSLRTDLATGVN